MIELLKAIAGWVIPIGAEAIVGGVTAKAVKNMSGPTKIAACISSMAIGWWVGDTAADYIDERLDEFQQKWDQYRLKGADE